MYLYFVNDLFIRNNHSPCAANLGNLEEQGKENQNYSIMSPVSMAFFPPVVLFVGGVCGWGSCIHINFCLVNLISIKITY